MKKANLVVGILLLIVLGFLGGRNYLNSYKSAVPSTKSNQIDPNNLPGIITGTAPWPVETEYLKQRLNILGLPALTFEGTILHTHQHLDIYIDGQVVAIPANVGTDPNQKFISPIHTHDQSRVVHVESPTVQTFTLGQFFDIWGVRITDSCLGGYCNQTDKILHVYSNGKLVPNNFRDLKLEAHQEIVIAFGTEKEIPSPIPQSYNFPAGY
ncbi:hypothetical protein A2160_03675 [Candidatus Beckwithbacteria bacterium RBG_13_42_9]|uniref:Uncharacterized protein n=1 Tax=Candidatus Beckwithbacteria bacterium RBG_13_42_9 TaxID=1797457 RepID=A0A1F5E8N8_9BACT|nr:MAG: hypothetical protein A2160_03675 [Candidatus Beckwithbacteria bacterium RBG_13_42_9]